MNVLVNIDVPDLGRAIAFYQAALGLTHTRTIDADVAELADGSCTLYLLQKPAGSTTSVRAANTRNYSRHWTPVHIDFVVDDLAAALQRAIRAGAEQETDCIHWRGSRCVTLSDPFGNGFCLIAFISETYSDNGVY